MDTWLAVVVIAAVVLVGLVVLAVVGLRTLAAVKRLVAAFGQTGNRFADATGLLRARRAGLRVAVAQRKETDTDLTRPQVPSVVGGRQEMDLIG